MSQDKRAALKRLLDGGAFIGAPGIFDGITARIADRMSFPALYLTGYGVSASLLAMPDAGYLTQRDMVHGFRSTADAKATPVTADAETGFGGAVNLQQTVRLYEAAGASAIQIEDQEFPKKCGHTLGRRVIPVEDMVTKIRVACDARRDPNFLIVARTDSRTSLGLDEALRRGEAFQQAGADVLFIESPESEEEMAAIGSRFDRPVLANMVAGGRTPVLSQARLVELGYQVAIFPPLGFLAMARAVEDAYAHLKATGSSAGCPVPLYDFGAMNEVTGFPDVWAFDKTYGRD